VADLLKKALPLTFSCFETVESKEFGSLPMKKPKGEGGLGDLATRIGNNFYNDYIRYFF
jgi:hypothetical protein